MGKAAYDALEPSNLLNKNAWLFSGGWIDYSADEIDGIEKLDFERRDERIKKMRAEALREIFLQRGFDGILEFTQVGKASWVIGSLMASDVLCDEELTEFLQLALKSILTGSKDVHAFKNLIGGAMRGLVDDEKREATLRNVSVNFSENDIIELLLLSPFGKSTWKFVDSLGEKEQARYWNEVIPDWIHDSDAENNEAVERLLKAERPRAAFSCIRYKPSQINAHTLLRLLSEMVQGGKDQAGEYMLERHNVEEAFKYLDKSPEVTLDQKASLEFSYIDVLEHPRGRWEASNIPNLEKYVEKHPELFVQAICWTYKRNDGATDPVEYQVLPENIKTMAERGYTLLENIQRIPGYNDLGELDADRLLKWISVVRQACNELGRPDTADICIGKLLSHAPVGKDEVWPCEPVRSAMEDVQSEPMMTGAHTGVYNSRGAHWRDEGGNQERELAEKYRKWGQALQVSHPFVASKLLMGLAKSYSQDATREDIEAGIRLRLH